MLSEGKLGDLHADSSLPSMIHWQRTFWIFGYEIWARRMSSPSPDFQACVWNKTCGMWPTDRPKLQHLPAIRAVRRRARTCHSACCAFAFTVALACCFLHQPGRDSNGIYLFALCWQRVLRCPEHQWVLPEWLLQDPTKRAEMILEIKHMAECEVSPAPGSQTCTVVNESVSVGLIMGNESKLSLWKLKLLMIVLSQILWSFEIPARNFEKRDLLQLHTVWVFKC